MRTFKDHVDAMTARFKIDVNLNDKEAPACTLVYTFEHSSDFERAFHIAKTTKMALESVLDENHFFVTAPHNHHRNMIQRIRSMGIEGSVINIERFNTEELAEGHRARGARKNWMNQQTRKKASQALAKAIGKIYYHDIPIDSIIKELKKVGVVVIDEDGTEWSGFLMGRDSSTLFRLGNMETAQDAPWNPKVKIYEPFNNAGLALQWYKQDKRNDGKWEINGYIT